jgi:glycosyltransferase involved in cell wall biosynthesis
VVRYRADPQVVVHITAAMASGRRGQPVDRTSPSTLPVLFDAQIVRRQRAGGISRYFVELAQALRADPELHVDVHTPWGRSTNLHAVEAGLTPPIPWGGRASDLIYLAGRASLSVPRVSKPAPDVGVVHHTYYHRPFLRRYRDVIRASTVHDMIPELFPELFRRGNPHLAKERYVRSSQLVLCPSEATADDLRRLYGELDGEVVVVPHGVGPPFTDPAPAHGRTELAEPDYALFVGDRRGYKDFRVALEALHRASQDSVRSPRRLIAVGGGPFSSDEQRWIGTFGGALEVAQVSANDRRLADLYRGAAVFLFPSRYEGFGIPTLEAMASRCPVVLPDCSSHPDVAGPAGNYFPPSDHEACARQIVRLVEDDEHRHRQLRAGSSRVASFTWERSARRAADAYHHVVTLD